MLTLICGRVKRLWPCVLEEVRQAMAEGRPCAVLVPEQYTLQAERDLIRDLNLPGLLDISVLSPSRLQQRVFDTAGANERVRLDQKGRRVAVARALGAAKDNLAYYRRAADKMGFITGLGDILASFKEEGVTPDELEQAAGKAGDAVTALKLKDMALVMRAYEDILAGRFADQADVLADMLARLPASGLTRDASVIVYGFDMLTAPLRQTVRALATASPRVQVLMVTGAQGDPDSEAFAPVLSSVNRLLAEAREEGIPCELRFQPPTLLNAPEDIGHLEQHFLAFKRPPYQGDARSVRLLAAPTPYAEAEYAAQQVKQALLTGTPPEKILVLMGSLQQYGSLVYSRLQAYGVPAYLAMKRPVITHGAVRLVLGALRSVTAAYQTEAVEEVMLSGFSPLTQREGWLLRAYARAYGIKGKQWLSPFDRGGEGERAQAEEFRLRLIGPLRHLHASVKEARDAAQSIEGVLAFLEEVGAYEAMERLEADLMERDMLSEASQSRQVWKKLMETFEQMHLLLGGERIPMGRFALWLEAALQETEVSALPPRSGCVQLGEIGNLLPHDPHVVLMLGLNDGLIAASEDVLLNDREQERAAQGLGKQLGLSAREKERLRLLDIWKALSSPTDKLLLSFSLAEENGTVLRPLSQLKAIRALLPGLTQEGGAFFAAQAALPLAPAPALSRLASLMREEALPETWQEAWAFLAENEEWKTRADMVLRAARGDKLPERLPQADARALYDWDSLSASRMESHAKCPFLHFVEYGLRPQKAKEWKVERLDRGSFYHQAMEEFSYLAARHGAWPDIDRQQCEKLMDQALAPLTAAWDNLPYGDSPRAKASSKRYVEACRRMAWTLTKGMQQSLFRVQEAELSFGEAGGLQPIVLTLPDGSLVRVTGKIDRVDKGEMDGRQYLRIVDYKSGKSYFDPTDVYAGLQLQLLIYMDALLEQFPDAVPAGLFYQKVEDPLLKKEEDISEEAAESEVTKELRLKGIALNDADIFRMMDGGDPPITLAKMFKPNGEPYANAPLVTREELNNLLAFARRRAADIAHSIRKGHIQAAPATDKQGSGPCAYCEYAGICRRDPMTSARMNRVKQKMKLRELIEETGKGQ